MVQSTIYDVARRAGVSHATVTRYFKHPELLSAATLEKVRQAVETLHYVPNAAAQSLMTGRSRMISLIVADITCLFFTSLMAGIEEIAQQEGYLLTLSSTNERPDKEIKLLDGLISYRPDGLILSSTNDSAGPLTRILHNRIATVLVDRELPGVELDTVYGDSSQGGRLLTEHLIEQGYRDIAFVGGPTGISSLEYRLEGYRSAMLRAGLAPRFYPGRYDVESGSAIVRDLYASGNLPEAIVAASSKVATGVLMTLRGLGLVVPDRVALASIDDLESTSLIYPFVTVANQPALEIGRVAMQMLLDRIHGETCPARKVVLPVELIIRKSSLKA